MKYVLFWVSVIAFLADLILTVLTNMSYTFHWPFAFVQVFKYTSIVLFNIHTAFSSDCQFMEMMIRERLQWFEFHLNFGSMSSLNTLSAKIDVTITAFISNLTIKINFSVSIYSTSLFQISESITLDSLSFNFVKKASMKLRCENYISKNVLVTLLEMN